MQREVTDLRQRSNHQFVDHHIVETDAAYAIFAIAYF
jgi:hypothetical protein